LETRGVRVVRHTRVQTDAVLVHHPSLMNAGEGCFGSARVRERHLRDAAILVDGDWS
jgi:hypothetical protein